MTPDIILSGHALQQMFHRGISVAQVQQAIDQGEVIKDYVDDKPYPSQLILLNVGPKPLHVVVAKSDTSNQWILITAYYPDKRLWHNDYRTRR